MCKAQLRQAAPMRQASSMMQLPRSMSAKQQARGISVSGHLGGALFATWHAQAKPRY